MPKSRIRIEQFDPSSHTRSKFDCGVERLDNFIKLTAKKQQKEDVTQVFVAVFQGQQEIIGYYSVNMGEVDIGGLPIPPKSLPQGRQLPVLFLGQIAVDRKTQNQGVGSLLMHDVFRKAVDSGIGCHAIALDIISDGSPEDYARRKSLYERFNYRSMGDHPERMFITLKDVRAFLESI